MVLSVIVLIFEADIACEAEIIFVGVVNGLHVNFNCREFFSRKMAQAASEIFVVDVRLHMRIEIVTCW